MVEGQEYGEIEEKFFSVPYKFYQLTKLRIWSSEKAIIGFDATFTVPDTFTGYAPYTYMFGSTSPVTGYSKTTIDDDIRVVQMQFDEKALRGITFLSELEQSLAEVVSLNAIG